MTEQFARSDEKTNYTVIWSYPQNASNLPDIYCSTTRLIHKITNDAKNYTKSVIERNRSVERLRYVPS